MKKNQSKHQATQPNNKKNLKMKNQNLAFIPQKLNKLKMKKNQTAIMNMKKKA